MTQDKIALHLEQADALEKLTELVQSRLVDCGWRDQVRLACRKQILEHHDDKVPTIDELITKITPKARSMVPDSVKKELLHDLEIILVGNDNAK